MKIRGWKRAMALLLAGTMVLLGGCSGRQGSGADGQGASGEKEQSGKEKMMGRYVEQEITLPEEMMEAGDYFMPVMQTMTDGSLALLEQNTGMFVSKDAGKTWERKETPWLKELENVYVSHMALAPDGSAAVVYSQLREETDDSLDAYVAEYLYVDPEGTVYRPDAMDSGDEIYQFWFDRESRLYGCSFSGNVFAVDPVQGKYEKCFELTTGLDYACFTEDYMVMLGDMGAVVYHLGEKRIVEDQVLQQFIEEHSDPMLGGAAGFYTITADAGEEPGVIYLAIKDGIYRHVIGGTVVEQIADGNLNSLGDPQTAMRGFAALAGDEFAILYDKGRLCRYVYDETVPAVPEEQLSVYSLEEDYTIRQAISLFQKENPGVYIRYEVGMSGADGMTAEDAIKNLNTKIMSGNGPDLLVMDGLPEKSYQQKGILADVTAIEKEMKGEDQLFPNLTDAFRKDGKLYSIPMRFQIPVIVGERAQMEGISDLSTLADTMEKLRGENPQGAILDLFIEKQLLRTLGNVSSAAWLDENGEMNKEALTDFLSQAKRIYQAEIAGYSEEELQEKRELFSGDENGGSKIAEPGISSAALGIAMENRGLGIGVMKGMGAEFNLIATLENQNDGFGYKIWQSDFFIPSTRLAIHADSVKKELAVEFFKFCFGSQLQDMELPSGFPVNQSSFEKLRKDEEADSALSEFAIVGDDGTGDVFSLTIRQASEEQFERLKEIVKTLKYAYIGDSMIMQAVCETGVRVLQGDLTAEEAADEIMKKTAIYLAE